MCHQVAGLPHTSVRSHFLVQATWLLPCSHELHVPGHWCLQGNTALHLALQTTSSGLMKQHHGNRAHTNSAMWISSRKS
jgi:hypothetical protein